LGLRLTWFYPTFFSEKSSFPCIPTHTIRKVLRGCGPNDSLHDTMEVKWRSRDHVVIG
jgi:hypothetical protein